VIEHVPEPTIVTVAPDIVQTAGVAEVTLTDSPDDAVTEMGNGGVPGATLPREANVMVWLPCVTRKLFTTGGAAE
jgi:hypothetical protein